MMTPTRAELLRLLERVSTVAPDVRFGQLAAFLPELADGDRDLWNLDDEAVVAALRRHLADLDRRQTDAA